MHVQVTRGPAALKLNFGRIIEAWQRQIPDLMCPYKFEGDRLFEKPQAMGRVAPT